MPHDLVTENLHLRSQLEQLLSQAQQNQQILKRFQTFDLQFIGAAGFRELIDTIFHSFTAASELDVATLVLLDPKYQIRHILSDLNINLPELPQLLFLQDETGFGELSDRLSKPVLGSYSEQWHRELFPDPIPAPASVAVVPLWRHERLIGCLNIGSRD
ncbi:MAG TPA: DUF484 family protein, partial [Noviherbaspirillum sp.]